MARKLDAYIRYIGDWMVDDSITPAEEEIRDTYSMVEASPYEYDFTNEDVIDKAMVILNYKSREYTYCMMYAVEE